MQILSFGGASAPAAVDYLVVAGGGSGGSESVQSGCGGGGGGGGLRSTVGATGGGGSLESALAVSPGVALTVTVGAGGAGITGALVGNNGSNSVNSKTVRIKVIKIKAVKILSKDRSADGSEDIKYSQSKIYWYNPQTFVVYDYDLKYPIGKVGVSDDNIPLKISEDTYIIDKIIPIPHIDSK